MRLQRLKLAKAEVVLIINCQNLMSYLNLANNQVKPRDTEEDSLDADLSQDSGNLSQGSAVENQNLTSRLSRVSEVTKVARKQHHDPLASFRFDHIGA